MYGVYILVCIWNDCFILCMMCYFVFIYLFGINDLFSTIIIYSSKYLFIFCIVDTQFQNMFDFLNLFLFLNFFFMIMRKVKLEMSTSRNI